MPDPEIVPGQPATPTSTPAPQHANEIFYGPNGIRAGWRVLIFLALVVVVTLVFMTPFVVMRAIKGGAGPQVSIGIGSLTPLGLGISHGSLFIIPSIAALIMARIERRKYGQYGLPARFAFRKDFWIGIVVGFLSISGCLLGIFALHGFHLTGLAIHGSTIASATVAWGITFVIVGLAEEFAFRGYLQFTLASGMGFWPFTLVAKDGFWPSAILMSALFGVAHMGNPGETWFGLFSVVLFGLLFCVFLRRTGNLWWAVGFHAGWDWGQTFFYGVPDSGLAPYHNLFGSAFDGPRWLTGGSVGPEASVFTPIVLGLVAILFTRVYRENKYRTIET
jgi:membrane protease YdiL (CAAX protease family)